ncbi:MAG: hypothetical protein KDB53_07200 [Planctomycetes bacterium]|nr:hypothetical protein [Planctomycetota bacterium]
MSSGLRLTLAGLLVLLTGGFVYYVSTSKVVDIDPATRTGINDSPPFPPTDAHGKLELVSSDQCQECHPAVYEEWKRSHHEFAWRNPEPRRKELSDNFKNQDCIPCHAPRPMIEVGYGKRPLERETRRDDGVNCFTCHRFQNVNAGANPLTPAAKDAPCNPVQWQPVADMAHCAPCHDQHKVKQDWMRSRYFPEGTERQDCNDCHMPVRPGPGTVGGPRATHRDHSFPAAHDPAMLKTSATLRAVLLSRSEDLATAARELTGRPRLRVQRDEATRAVRLVLVELKNTGVGHNFPADERHRAVDLELRHDPLNGRPADELRLARFRNPYRHEFEIGNEFEDRAFETLEYSVTLAGMELPMRQMRLLPEFNPDREIFYPKSTQLHAGESRLVWFAVPDAIDGALRLRVYYKLNPFVSNDDAVVCNEIRLDLGE